MNVINQVTPANAKRSKIFTIKNEITKETGI